MKLAGLAVVTVLLAGSASAAPDGGKDENVLKAGKIPVVEFLRFIQKVTGETVLYPSAGQSRHFGPEATIEVLAEVRPFTLPIAKALLEGNGYRIVKKTLSDGDTLYEVSHKDDKNSSNLFGDGRPTNDLDPKKPAPPVVRSVALKPFLKSLDEQLRMPVLYSSRPKSRKLEKTNLRIYGAAADYDADTRKAMLEVAGFTVIESIMEGRAIAQVHAPRRFPPQRHATLVVTPKHESPGQLLALLREILAPPPAEKDEAGEEDDAGEKGEADSEASEHSTPVRGTFAYRKTSKSLVFHGHEETLKALVEVAKTLDRPPTGGKPN